jgi:hypothetical protein
MSDETALLCWVMKMKPEGATDVSRPSRVGLQVEYANGKVEGFSAYATAAHFGKKLVIAAEAR